MTDLTTSSVGATQATVAQKLSATTAKTTKDAQKVEGQAAVDLIESVAQLNHGPTGNNVDIQV